MVFKRKQLLGSLLRVSAKEKLICLFLFKCLTSGFMFQGGQDLAALVSAQEDLLSEILQRFRRVVKVLNFYHVRGW